MQVPPSHSGTHGVSVITCTNRRSYRSNLFHNYSRQRYPTKELLIVVNDDGIPLEPYLRLARKLPNVRVFRVPGRVPLGACLNYAVKRAKHRYIAKFDDDDYYAPDYLADSLQSMRRSKADVVGKRAHYMYLRGSRKLILRFPHDEHRTVSRLPGATLLMKRSVFRRVRFPHRNVGEDDLFCIRSKRKGYKVYSGGKYNFVAVRRRNSAHHTWIINDRELLANHRTVPHVRNYKKFVRRRPGGARP